MGIFGMRNWGLLASGIVVLALALAGTTQADEAFGGSDTQDAQGSGFVTGLGDKTAPNDENSSESETDCWRWHRHYYYSSYGYYYQPVYYYYYPVYYRTPYVVFFDGVDGATADKADAVTDNVTDKVTDNLVR